MYKSLHYSDLPMLLAKGAQFGLTEEFLWITDNFGQEYQVVCDGEFLRFGKRRPSGGVDSHELMDREEFYQRFMYADVDATYVQGMAG